MAILQWLRRLWIAINARHARADEWTHYQAAGDLQMVRRRPDGSLEFRPPTDAESRDFVSRTFW